MGYHTCKNKCIVLYDALIQQCENDEEIIVVIAHELGHWKLNHTIYSFIAVQILTSCNLEADAFTKKLGCGAHLHVGLVNLQEENLSTMNTDPWYFAYPYSHLPRCREIECN